MCLRPTNVWLCIGLAALVAMLPRASIAGSETTAGVTINGTTGAHVEPFSIDSVPFVPLPIFEFNHQNGQIRLHLEGVPPIGAVSLSGGRFGTDSQVTASYLSGDLSVALRGNRYGLGIGEVVVNQQTDYPRRAETQYSRVVGMRYIVRGILYSSERERVELSLALSPRVHAVQHTVFRRFSFADPEHGSLLDTSLRWSIPHERWTFTYGLRYINYTAAYDRTNSLADRNHLLMPFIGFERRLR